MYAAGGNKTPSKGRFRLRGVATMRVVRINAQLQWTIRQGSGGAWVGICDPLKLTVQSDTWAELMEDIGLTLDAVLKDLLVSNELPRFLRDRGWQLMGSMPTHLGEVRFFDVPFYPVMAGVNGPQTEFRQ